MTYTVTGKSEGLHVVVWENGKEERLTDDQLAELKGGKFVKKLEDERIIADLRREVSTAQETIVELQAANARLSEECKQKTAVLGDFQARAENAESKAGELASALQASERKVADLEVALADAQKPKEELSAPVNEGAKEIPTEHDEADASAAAVILEDPAKTGEDSPTEGPVVFTEEQALGVELKDLGTWEQLKACAEALGLTVKETDTKKQITAAIKAERDRRVKAAG